MKARPKRAASGPARRADRLADALQADAVEGGDRLLIEAEGGEGEGGEHRRGTVLRHDDRGVRFPPGETGGGGGGAGAVGDGDEGVEALAAKTGGNVIGEGRLAAEEMGGAGNVEEEAVAVEGDQRGVALGPVGDAR